MKRTVLLMVNEDLSMMVETEFTGEDLMKAGEEICDDLMDSDDGWNEQKILDVLQEKGYVKVLGPAPEIVDLML
jgi:hypothetical protein